MLLVANLFENLRNVIFSNWLLNRVPRVIIYFSQKTDESISDVFLFVGTESSRSIDQTPPCHQIVSLIENKAKKLCKNQGGDMVL